MKKTIAIFLVLVIGMVGVFAANNATTDLTLKTTVADIYELIISPDSVLASVTDIHERITAFDNLESVTDKTIVFDAANKSHNLFVSYKSNIKNKATVTTTFNPMAATGLDTKIGYTVVVTDGDTYTVKNNSTNMAASFFTEGDVTHGMRVESVGFMVSINEDDWAVAGKADYEITWTVGLLVQ